MINKNKIKFVKSLESKRIRNDEGCFVVEGEKIVGEVLQSELIVRSVFYTSEWADFQKIDLKTYRFEIERVSKEEMTRLSFLKTPSNVLCVVEKPTYFMDVKLLGNQLSLMLDTVQDPGNLGTIVRIADWFGIETIICTLESADVFNPKVVQSTMGAICRVKVFYMNFDDILPKMQALQIPIYGTTLGGENMYDSSLTKNGIIMMGNESVGIHSNWMRFITNNLYIPNFPKGEKRSESLNVAIATALVCGEFRRRVIV